GRVSMRPVGIPADPTVTTTVVELVIWAWKLFVPSLILIAVGVAVMVVFPVLFFIPVMVRLSLQTSPLAQEIVPWLMTPTPLASAARRCVASVNLAVVEAPNSSINLSVVVPSWLILAGWPPSELVQVGGRSSFVHTWPLLKVMLLPLIVPTEFPKLTARTCVELRIEPVEVWAPMAYDNCTL